MNKSKLVSVDNDYNMIVLKSRNIYENHFEVLTEIDKKTRTYSNNINTIGIILQSYKYLNKDKLDNFNHFNILNQIDNKNRHLENISNTFKKIISSYKIHSNEKLIPDIERSNTIFNKYSDVLYDIDGVKRKNNESFYKYLVSYSKYLDSVHMSYYDKFKKLETLFKKRQNKYLFMAHAKKIIFN